MALEIEVIAETVGILHHAVQPPGRDVIDLVAEIDRAPLRPFGADADADVPMALEVCALGHAVDHAACAATTKSHAARPFQHFDALQVVEVALVLRIVTHAIDEEVGCGIDPAQHRLVAVTLTLPHQRAGHVTQHIGHAGHRLIFHQLGWHDLHRCRHFLERRVGLGEGGGAIGAVAVDRTVGSFSLRAHGNRGQHGVFRRIRRIGNGDLCERDERQRRNRPQARHCSELIYGLTLGAPVCQCRHVHFSG